LALFKRSVRSMLANGWMRLWFRPRFKSGANLNVQKFRDFIANQLERGARVPKDLHIEADELAGLEARWLSSAHSRKDKILLYIHGGAFLFTMPRSYNALVGNLLQRLEMTAVLPEYRLAPEHPFPAAVEDCCAVYEALLEKGYSSKDIVVMGDSAGGNLSLVLLQYLVKKQLPLPSCAVFLSPATQFSERTPSAVENRYKDPIFPKQATQAVFANYLQGNLALTKDPRVSPMNGNFEGLPPLLFIAGSTEILRDDSVLAAEKAQAAGVDATCSVWYKMPHVFQLYDFLPETKRSMDDIASFVRKHVGL